MRSPVVVLYCLIVPAVAAQQRAYRIDDAFATEEVGSVTVTPDGQAVAFTKLRAANSQLTSSLTLVDARSDIWLQEAPGRPARNLTNGQADSSGWWRPEWSPDGQRLAFLSSRGGQVTVWAWERAQNRVRQLSKNGLDFSQHGGCRWVDGQRLLCLAMPEGERSTPTNPTWGGPAIDNAEAAWAGAKRGELTVSVVNSLEFKLPGRRLVLVDAASATSQTLAPTQLSAEGGWNPTWWLSPTGKAVGLVRPGAATYPLQQRARLGFPATVELQRLDGRPLQLSRALPTNVVTSSIQWSPDGQAMAFFALGDALVHPELLYGPSGASEVRHPAVDSKEYPGRLWRVDLGSGLVEQLGTGDIDLGQSAQPPAFQWTADGEMLVRAPRLVRGARPLTPAEPEWLILSRDGRTRSLGAGRPPLPQALDPIDAGVTFIGLLDGEVWQLKPRKGRAKLIARLDPKMQVAQAVRGAKSTTHVVLSWLGSPEGESEKAALGNYPYMSREFLGSALGMGYLVNYALLDLATGTTTPLAKPAPQATLVTYDRPSRNSFWQANDTAGTFLWRSDGNRAIDSLVATNRFWSDVTKGEQRPIDYTTLNGEPVQAKLVLPIGYQPGRRYPLVVDLEIGSTKGNASYAVDGPSALPHPVEDAFAAAGYAYLFAHWPTTSMDQNGRANLLLGPNGIIPAVERAIALGIADPERLFLNGASSAGYGVYALVTQTTRFKAAVANVGATDQVTYTLQTTLSERYTDNPFDDTRLGNAYYLGPQPPLWRNGNILRRNSPLSYVDRVQTPLMIVQNDLDHHLIGAEMFFRALVMQRKPAHFVRYWGEGHIIHTPANRRDYWQRVFAWYDQWGDIARDTDGNMLFEGDRVKSRNGAPALRAEAYAKFPLFGPGGTSARPAPPRAAAARHAGRAH